MEKKFGKIAVLTSGGDAPGMNAAVRAVVNCANAKGIEVYGLMRGYSGLLEDDMKLLSPRDVANIAGESGTILYSDRCLEFKTEKGMKKALATCKRKGIDGVVAIGGDGTFRGATDLSNHGIPTIGIPGTIDNDITSTDYTIGFDTAMNTVLEMVDRLRDTCESHARCNVVEVMGRHAGDIALYTAMATGAVALAIPEMPFDEEACIRKIKKLRAKGQRSFIVIVAEGYKYGEGYGEDLAKRIQKETKFGEPGYERKGVETKFARLAHVVRGGEPTLRDRVAAARFSERAVEELLKGNSNIVICEQAGEYVAVDINYALALDTMWKNIDKFNEKERPKFDAKQIAAMEATCKDKQAFIKKMYKIVNDLAR